MIHLGNLIIRVRNLKHGRHWDIRNQVDKNGCVQEYSMLVINNTWQLL